MTKDAARPKETGTRLRVAEVLAFVALVAALIGALGPAERLSTTYSWPPPELPESAPSRVWYTPLLLQRRFPESLNATLPCSLQPALGPAGRPVTVLATARSPEQAGGLTVRQQGDRLVVGVGHRFVAHLPLASRRLDGNACRYELTIAQKRWSVTGGPNQIERFDDLERMPVVNGLFSELDLAAVSPFAVKIRSEVHGAAPTARQTVAWIVAALCLLAALLLVAFERRASQRTAARERLRRVVAAARPVDAAIAMVLLLWWMLAPAFWDDGWTMARHEAFRSTGAFSNYYDSFGAALPLGYWLEWLQHWLTESTTAILVLRLPALLCMAGTWMLARWILGRILNPARVTTVVLWTLAASFAVGTMAWGMTLRLEPVVAVLVTATMACAIRFVESPSAATLALIAALVPLAITAHPVGVVSLAPLILLGPAIWRWIRARAAVAVTVATSGIALFLVLGFVGSDVRQRSTDAQIISEASTTVVSWRDELTRYDVFSAVRSNEFDGYGTPLRRASVALMALAILAWLVRLRRRVDPFDYLPTATLALSLVLLVTTPSKWPWHFGALVAVLALAVAVETSVLARSPGSTWKRVLVVATIAAAILWSWAPQRPWNTLDLRTLDWTRPFDGFPLAAVAVVPILVLVGVFAPRGGRDGADRLWRFVPWTLPAVLLPMVAFTLAFLVADTAATNSWTLTRQTIAGIGGSAGCGLADDLRTPSSRSVRQVQAIGADAPRPLPDWVPPLPVAGLRPFVLRPPGEGSAATPWFPLDADGRIGLYVSATAGAFDRITVEWGRVQGDRVDSVGFEPPELLSPSQANAIVQWRLVAEDELPEPPEDADAVRLVLHSEAAPSPALAVAPVAYSDEPLARRLAGVRSLIAPNIRMYFPCAEHARLSGGTAEPASIVLTTSDSVTPFRYESSPFSGLTDLYRFERVSVADSEEAPENLVVFAVDDQIPGGAKASPEVQP